jgi:selenocysteine-specific elongation factor
VEEIATAVCLEEPADGAERRVLPGHSAYVQFRLRNPVLLLPGDHFIIRKLSPLLTIGGGRVLNNWVPASTVSARSLKLREMQQHLAVWKAGSNQEILDEIVRRSPGRWMSMEDLIARTGWLAEECRQEVAALQQAGRLTVLSEKPLRFAQTAYLDELSAAVLENLRKFHHANPLLPGASLEAIRAKTLSRAPSLLADGVLRQLTAQKQIVVSGETIRLAAHRIILKDEEAQAKQQIVHAFERAGLKVPTVKEVLQKLPVERQRSEKILKILIQEGALVRVSEDLVFHSMAMRHLRHLLAQFKLQNNRINVSTFKDLAQVSRKYAIPLLEYLDREHVTRRAGDERILL